MNLHIFKLDLEKEQRSNCQHMLDHRKKQGNSKKTSISASLLKPLAVCITTNCGKFLKGWEYQTALTCLLRNLCAGQEETELRMEQQLIPNSKRRTSKMYIVTCLFNLYSEFIMWNARLYEGQTWIKIVRRNINNLRYTDDTTLMAESEEELKTLLMKVKELA